MTREEAKELLPIIQAFAEGKTIEFINDDGEWEEVDFPTWGKSFTYRIKPEPKYRPFNSQEECWQEMQKHQPFGWVKEKTMGEYRQVVCIFNEKELMFNVASSFREFSSKMIFNNYTFIDGTPFGIKEE